MRSSVMRTVCVGSLCTVLPHPHNQYRPYSLRHPVLAALSAFLLVTKVAVIGLTALTPEVASLSTISASFLIRETNASRAENGLPALTEHPLLNASARLKAADMLAYDYFEHTSPAGITPWKWFDDAGYAYVYGGENLAIDFTTGEGIHKAWMNSPGHRKNIVSDRYRNIGIAVLTGEFEGRTTTVVVQHFGSLSAAPVTKAPVASPVAASPTPTTLSPSPRATAAPAVATPAPPTILEPTEGQLLPSGASTVRGTSERETNVQVALDGRSIGTFSSSDGTFAGSITLPADEERAAVLTATATRSGRTSPPSAPRHVRIDTRGPEVPDATALLLPDPTGDSTRTLVLIPTRGEPASASLRINADSFPLSFRESLAIGTIPSALAAEPLTLRIEDAAKNVRMVELSSGRAFHVTPRTAGEADMRLRIEQTAKRVHGISTAALFAVAILLALNILVYVRIQHADLIAHGLFVLVLGAFLLLTT